MSLDKIIANYIAQQRCLGKRFSAEATILATFKSAVSDVPLRDIRPDMISALSIETGRATRQSTRSTAWCRVCFASPSRAIS